MYMSRIFEDINREVVFKIQDHNTRKKSESSNFSFSNLSDGILGEGVGNDGNWGSPRRNIQKIEVQS